MPCLMVATAFDNAQIMLEFSSGMLAAQSPYVSDVYLKRICLLNTSA